ncbi:SMP-30/gluconolactonase/LRE family protein [Mycolicibacterium farcinogenes]|uniref:SMP-30/gluconolactonase/LRE family protein n=1 Tax=Mycolicibacterium farcinogenes TaxID=1802 RepID=UPI001C8D06F2|nr:SMP-30/gluconolactonase/LRE family protein [Mycolicibacterium farcinogenes]QZH60898.1 SMP-30/gluconolactonase/LRE family protein [Mycolicibacterium farcinogenes]
MRVEVNDDRCRELVDVNVVAHRVATGFVFTEGPVWIHEDQYLLFSDLRGNVRARWSASEGCRVVCRNTHKANGMTRHPDGDLIVCEPASSRVVRMSKDGTGADRREIASHFGDKELNSPSDCVVGSDGTIWFTDPTAGRRNDISGIKREPELDFKGLYRLRDPGQPELVADGFDLCNGLCFSPDESRLYVADTTRCHIVVFDVDPDGSVADRSVFASGIGTFDINEGYVDGLRCDEHGNVWVTGPRGIWIFAPDGTHLGVVPIPEVATNLTWAGPDSKTVFVTATQGLYRFEALVNGAR